MQQSDSQQLIPTNLPQEIQTELNNQYQNLNKQIFLLDDLPEILEKLFSSDLFKFQYGIIGLRKLLENTEQIQKVIDSQIVPKIINIIQNEQIPQFIFEAIWALSNITCGTSEQIKIIVNLGGAQQIIKLLTSPYSQIIEKTVFALGNIAIDCTENRDLLLNENIVDQLIKILNNQQNDKIIKYLIWILCNLCRGKPLPEFKFVKNLLPIFCKIIIDETNQDNILYDSLLGLSALIDNSDINKIQILIDCQVIPILIKLLNDQQINLIIPTIRILGNTLTGNEIQTNYVLNLNLLKQIPKLLTHKKPMIRRDTCWILSNITAGNYEQINKVIKDSIIMEQLFSIMKKDKSEIIIESLNVIINSIKNGHKEDIQLLIEKGIFKIIIELMKSNDIQLLITVLDLIFILLKKGNNDSDDENLYLTQFEQMGEIEKLDQLQLHGNHKVYEKTFKILEYFFQTESELL